MAAGMSDGRSTTSRRRSASLPVDPPMTIMSLVSTFAADLLLLDRSNLSDGDLVHRSIGRTRIRNIRATEGVNSAARSCPACSCAGAVADVPPSLNEPGQHGHNLDEEPEIGDESWVAGKAFTIHMTWSGVHPRRYFPHASRRRDPPDCRETTRTFDSYRRWDVRGLLCEIH